MTRFNEKTDSNTRTLNHEGAIAYMQSKEEELLSAVISGFLTETFYETSDNRLERIKTLVSELSKTNPKFLLGLAQKVRTEYKMRTTSHVLVSEITKHLKGNDYNMQDFVCDSIERVDDITEILGYLLPEGKKDKHARKGVLTHGLLKGLGKAFYKFDEYQLAKYNRDYKINLKDIIRLTHVKGELAGKVLNETLATPETWEVMLSSVSKEDLEYVNKVFNIWKGLLNEKKLPYMAMIKNLRNILWIADKFYNHDNSIPDCKEQAGDFISGIISYIKNEEAIRKGNLLPFRYLSAYREISKISSYYSQDILLALEEAAATSVKNMKIDGNIAVFADVSSSMEDKLSSKSSLERIDIALLFAGMTIKIGKQSLAGIFGSMAKFKNVGTSVFHLNNTYVEGEVGYATYGHKAIDLLIEKHIKVDKILFFTDCQLYSETDKWGNRIFSDFEKSIKTYVHHVNPNVKVFCFDLAGYGTVVSNNPNVYSISGWSEKIFEYIDIIEKTKTDKSIIKEIEQNGQKYINTNKTLGSDKTL